MYFSRVFLLALFATLSLSTLSIAATPSIVSATSLSFNSLRQDSSDPAETAEPDDSMEPSASPGADDDEVCVDAKHLAQYPSHMLVHAKPIRAPVLCPSSSDLPCATADHKLRFNGVPMSYRQYCDTAATSCEKKRMPVNSVLSHLWTESSHDNGQVVLTMFDARHPEMVQILIHRATSLRRSISHALV